MPSPAGPHSDGLRTFLKRLRAWFSRKPSSAGFRAASDNGDDAAREEVRRHLAERRAATCHWLFLVRAGLALGIAGYLAVGALATGAAWPGRALLLLPGYAAANAVVRFGAGRGWQGAPWGYALLDAGLVLLLYAFWGGVFEPTLAPGVVLVGMLVLLLLPYTLLGNPSLNAALSLTVLGVAGSMLYLFPDFAAGGAPADGAAAGTPVRSFLLVEYLSIACLVSCLLALRLRRRLVDYSNELHRRLEATLKADLEEERRRQVEAVGQLKRDFITVLSHELRTPLGPLVSSLEAVQADAEDGRCNAALVDVAADAAHELQQLVNDYTQLARLLTNPLEEGARQNVPLGLLAETTAEHLREHLGEHDPDAARPQFVFEALDDRAVASDPPLLRHAMHALLRRAAHHTPGGSTVTVCGLPPNEQGEAGFSVHDPDSHLDPDAVASLDDLFAPSDERLYSKSATGLELLLARHALHHVGGRLSVESHPEHGTTVSCRLPAASPDHAWVDEERLRAPPADDRPTAPRSSDTSRSLATA
jgi:signal transduction histidine kinase